MVFDPFCGAGTTAVAAKELIRAFVGARLEEEFAKLAARHVQATERGTSCVKSPSSSGTMLSVKSYAIFLLIDLIHSEFIRLWKN
jgi:hypothetical protein